MNAAWWIIWILNCGGLWLFDTCGMIFGPAIILSGIAALAVCVRMSFGPRNRRARLRTVALSALPTALGIGGFLFGLVFCSIAGTAEISWLALGKVILAGAVVSAVPLVWSLLLLRNRGSADLQVAGGS